MHMVVNLPCKIDTLLTYAINDKGHFVKVDDVPAGVDCNCFCPACNEPLIAKNKGNKRVHHFAHKSGTECVHAFESMLHILAKEKIREEFLTKQEFWIEFEYKSFCLNSKDCKFVRYGDCCESKMTSFNLKEYYDSCEQEFPYDGIKRRSDLKFFSSNNPNRAPVYIEFCVTHASGSDKLHSGNKVIEIKIGKVKDIQDLVEYGIRETKSLKNSENGKKKYPEVFFFGFKNCDYENNYISVDIEFSRFILYKSGKMQSFQDECNCRELSKSKPFSLLEMCFHTPVAYGVFNIAKFMAFRQYRIPNCLHCINYVDEYNSDKKICRLYKVLGISRNEYIDTARAKTCPSFKVDEDKMNFTLKSGIGTNYTILD